MPGCSAVVSHLSSTPQMHTCQSSTLSILIASNALSAIDSRKALSKLLRSKRPSCMPALRGNRLRPPRTTESNHLHRSITSASRVRSTCIHHVPNFIQLRLDSKRAHTGLPRRRPSEMQPRLICRDQVSNGFNLSSIIYLHRLSTVAFQLRPPPSPNPDPRQTRAAMSRALFIV